MTWQQLTLHIPSSELPRTELLLELAGAVSITIGDDGDTEILEPAPGTTPLWPRLTIRALFPGDCELGGFQAVLGISQAPDLKFERIDDADLAAASTQIIEPVEIGPLLAIVPADESFTAGGRELGLHMGLAFGTGRHPTTRLCLEWLASATIDGARVLDYGCGTGVLALAALRLGARQATAIDNEPQALDATRRNARLNELEERVIVEPPKMSADGPFDLVLANILARPLIELAAVFAAAQPSGGRIVLSGLLESQLDEIENHYRRWYESFGRRKLGGWGLLTGTRRNEYDR